MEPMSLIAWIVVGAIAGWLAGMVMKSGGGLLTDIIVGVIGAFIGGIIFSAIGQSGATGINVYSIVVAFVGAVVLLAVIRLINSRGRRLSN